MGPLELQPKRSAQGRVRGGRRQAMLRLLPRLRDVLHDEELHAERLLACSCLRKGEGSGRPFSITETLTELTNFIGPYTGCVKESDKK